MFFLEVNPQKFRCDRFVYSFALIFQTAFLYLSFPFPRLQIIMSEFLESSSASFAYPSSHYILYQKLGYFCKFFYILYDFTKKSLLIVVCATIHMSFEAKLPSISLFTSLIMTALLSHQPFIPITSGWFLSPTIII